MGGASVHPPPKGSRRERRGLRLAVLTPYTEPSKGGITSYTRELVSAYRKQGIETVGFAESGETNPDFEVIKGSKIGFAVRVAWRILRWRADVVHGHSHWPELLPCLAVKVLRPRTRVLFTFHTPPRDPDNRPGLLRRARHELFLTLVRLCDGVAFSSRDAEREVTLPPRVRHDVIHAAPESFSWRMDEHRGEVKRDTIVLAVAVMTWPRKVEGVLLLLDAFANVAPSFPGWRVEILGDGPLRHRVEDRISSLGLGGRAILKGFIDDVRHEMVTASVFAQVSFLEGLPIALLDAMAMGLPVIATTVGDMPEVVQNRVTGLLVEPSREGVSGALVQLLGNPDLRRTVGEAARAWTARELSWEKVATRGLELAGVMPR